MDIYTAAVSHSQRLLAPKIKWLFTRQPFLMSIPVFMGRTDFSDQFRKMVIHHKRIGYDFNAMRHSACLVINSITVDSFSALFYCTPVDRASDSMMAPT